MSCRICFMVLAGSLASWLIAPGTLRAAPERPNVAFTGIYLMGNNEAGFPVYSRNKANLRDALRKVMKQVDVQGKLPFSLRFESNIEETRLSIDNTLSLAFLVVRDDVVSESFAAAGTSLNKSIVNVGLVALLYDTRKLEGKDRNTILFSIPLVGYAQRLDGDRQISREELDDLFIDTAETTVRDNLAKRLRAVSLEDINGEVVETSDGSATVSIGALKGVEEGQNVTFLVEGARAAAGPIVQLGRDRARVTLPKGFSPSVGMQVKATNMRASSDETFQVVAVKVSSKQAAKSFPPEEIGPRLAQWYSNFLSERGGKVVLPSRVGGSWDEKATSESFSILGQDGNAYQLELPKPKYPVTLDITGVASKIVSSNEVNDICLYKAWIKLTIPDKNFEKTFDVVSSKSLIKGVQSFAEKDELYDLFYQLSAKIAKEAGI